MSALGFVGPRRTAPAQHTSSFARRPTTPPPAAPTRSSPVIRHVTGGPTPVRNIVPRADFVTYYDKTRLPDLDNLEVVDPGTIYGTRENEEERGDVAAGASGTLGPDGRIIAPRAMHKAPTIHKAEASPATLLMLGIGAYLLFGG